MRMKQIVIFGSTGSVGTKALQICERNPESFKVIGLTTNTNIKNFWSKSINSVRATSRLPTTTQGTNLPSTNRLSCRFVR